CSGDACSLWELWADIGPPLVARSAFGEEPATCGRLRESRAGRSLSQPYDFTDEGGVTKAGGAEQRQLEPRDHEAAVSFRARRCLTHPSCVTQSSRGRNDGMGSHWVADR